MIKRSRESGLKQVIQDKVKLFILEKGLGPGDLLPPEGQFAEDLGVSRGSVREAVKSLESLGIVESRHGEGVCVREFNFDAIFGFLSFGLSYQPSRAHEILQIREWLEESAVTAVAEVISTEQIERIESLLADWEEKAKLGEPTVEQDRNFHRLFYEPLGNASLLSLIDIFWVVYNALARSLLPVDPDPLRTVRIHRELFHAVCAHDADPMLRRQCLREHFRNVEQRFEQALTRREEKNGEVEAG